MIIKKIFKNEIDEEVHSDFLKFGRGEYKNRYLIDLKKQKGLFVVKTGPEFVNFLVKKCLEGIEGEISIKGCIVSTFDLSGEIMFKIEKTKNFMGIRQIILNTEIDPKEILSLMEKYPRAFFALSFSTPKCELKIKAKAPKSAKPSTKTDKEVKADFCSLKTSDQNIIQDLFFDIPELDKPIKIRHTIEIDEIVYPTDEKDPKIIREKSKRKGKVIREIELDGQQKGVFEKDFEA